MNCFAASGHNLSQQEPTIRTNPEQASASAVYRQSRHPFVPRRSNSSTTLQRLARWCLKALRACLPALQNHHRIGAVPSNVLSRSVRHLPPSADGIHQVHPTGSVWWRSERPPADDNGVLDMSSSESEVRPCAAYLFSMPARQPSLYIRESPGLVAVAIPHHGQSRVATQSAVWTRRDQKPVGETGKAAGKSYCWRCC